MEKALDNEPIVVYYNQAVSDDGTDKESVVTWSSIEVVITSTTGNRVAAETARGFESLLLRHIKTSSMDIA